MNPRKGCLDPLRLVDDLRPRESQGEQARARMRLVPGAVARLLSRRSVITQSIGLDYESERWPEEVGPDPFTYCCVSGCGSPARFTSGRKRRSSAESVRGECTAVENLLKSGDPWMTGHGLQRQAKRLRIHEIAPICLVDSPLELIAVQARREVHECRWDRRHGNSMATGEVDR